MIIQEKKSNEDYAYSDYKCYCDKCADEYNFDELYKIENKHICKWCLLESYEPYRLKYWEME